MTVPVLSNGLRLGLKIERPRPVTFLMGRYIDRSALPPVPKNFGHQKLLGTDFGMLGNDQAGDCFWAGAAHQTMLWSREAQQPASFTTASALQAYAEATGYDPAKADASGQNPTDQGTDLASGCSYWQKTGIPDATGKRHMIAAYFALDPTNPDDLFYATYLFSGAGLGVNLPSSAEEQFDRRECWTYVPASTALGGHFVNCFGRQDGLIVLGTWGRTQPCSQYWLSRYAVQAVAFVTTENLVNNRSPEGFDSAQLLADLAALR